MQTLEQRQTEAALARKRAEEESEAAFRRMKEAFLADAQAAFDFPTEAIRYFGPDRRFHVLDEPLGLPDTFAVALDLRLNPTLGAMPYRVAAGFSLWQVAMAAFPEGLATLAARRLQDQLKGAAEFLGKGNAPAGLPYFLAP